MSDRASGSSRRLRWMFVAVLGAALVAGWGSIRTSTGPAEGVGRGATTRPAEAVLRVATLNMHSGIGVDDRFDLSRTAAAIAGNDIVGLNEVRGDLLAGEDQARLLGRQMKMDWLFAPTEHRWWHDHFGNAALSRVAIEHWMRIPLPCTQSRGFRNVLWLTVPCGGKRVNLLITHLDRQRDHDAHVRTLTQMFLALAEPAIAMGDFNGDSSDPGIQRLLNTPGVVDAIGQGMGGKTPPHIDWIFLRGMKCRSAGLLENGASDHPAAWAEVELPR